MQIKTPRHKILLEITFLILSSLIIPNKVMAASISVAGTGTIDMPGDGMVFRLLPGKKTTRLRASATLKTLSANVNNIRPLGDPTGSPTTWQAGFKLLWDDQPSAEDGRVVIWDDPIDADSQIFRGPENVGGRLRGVSPPLKKGNHTVSLVPFGNVSPDTNGEAADSVSFVPEPLTILGSLTAIGIGIGLKKKYSRKLQKASTEV